MLNKLYLIPLVAKVSMHGVVMFCVALIDALLVITINVLTYINVVRFVESVAYKLSIILLISYYSTRSFHL